MNPVSVIHEDNHLLVLNKPAGIATMGTSSRSLWQLAKAYIKHKYQKPGNVYLGVVSRLDLPVSGVVVFARTSKSAARLARQYRERAVDKRYWCVVDRPPTSPHGQWVDWLARDPSSPRMLIRAFPFADAREAVTEFRLLQQVDRFSRLELCPITGRRHQLRAQTAFHGLPIVGDIRYGGTAAGKSQIALHARSVTFRHPTSQQPMTFTAPVPKSWSHFKFPGAG